MSGGCTGCNSTPCVCVERLAKQTRDAVARITSTRYCIGCIHLYLQPKFDGYQGSEETGKYGEEDPALLCNKGHWREELDEDRQIAFGANMTRARTCEDYEERSL